MILYMDISLNQTETTQENMVRVSESLMIKFRTARNEKFIKKVVFKSNVSILGNIGNECPEARAASTVGFGGRGPD